MQTTESTFDLTSLYLYQTDSCNLCCSHCWISPKFSQRKQNGIPFDSLKRPISDAKALGLQSVKITGGEPLLYNELPSLLSFLDSQGLNVSIETNGTLLDEEIVSHIKTTNVQQVSVSVDAASEDYLSTSHPLARGTEGQEEGRYRPLDGMAI